MQATAARRGLAGWAVVAVLFWATTSVEALSWTQLGAYTPTYLRTLGVSPHDLPGWTAAMASVSWLIGIPMAPFWGVLADRYSRKAIVVRSAIVEAVIFAGWAAASGPWMALFFNCLSGFVLGNTGVMLAIQASLTTPQRLGLAVGIVGAGGPTGLALGPVTGALLIHPFGVRGMLLFDAAAAVIMAVLLLLLVREPPRDRPVGVGPLRLLRDAVAEILANPMLWRMFAALFAALAAAWLTRPFLPILIARFAELRLYDATAAVGVVLSAVGTAQAVSSPIWGRVIDRYGQVRVLMLTTLAGAGALLFAGFASGLYSLAAWLLVYGCVAAALSTGTMALLARTVTPERRGAVLGQIYFPFYVSGLVGPPAGAFLFVHGQLPLFAAAAGLTLVPFALLLSRWRSAA